MSILRHKICIYCKVKKPIKQFEIKNKKTGNRRNDCRGCRAENKSKWYHANRERLAEKEKVYRELHREEIAAYQKEYQQVNKGRLVITQKAYREAHKEKA